jgi:hypothetical protein
MTFVSAHSAASHAERLLEILREIGAKPIASHGVEGGVLSLWEILNSLANPGDPSDPVVIARSVVGAGIHDLAAKITSVWDGHVSCRDLLKPHLLLLAETYHVGQNAPNESWDRIAGEPLQHDSANKVIELYLACICILCDMSVKLDHPVKSKGENPDVIATARDGTRWAFALKTQAKTIINNTAPNLRGLLNGAAEQILCCECDKGVVVVNLKNVIDHDQLRASGPFLSAADATAALEAQVDELLERLHKTESADLKPEFAQRGKLSPVVLFIAHATVLCFPPEKDKPAFTEIKSLKARTLPTKYHPSPGTFAAEVKCLAERLNHFVQVII